MATKAWKETTLGKVLTFQRGFDITKKEQIPGPYNVISSSGSKSTHCEFKVRGPGVVIGRKGSLGTVFFSCDDFWPHDTTLWIKNFHGNDEKFAYYFLQTMHLEQYDAGASNPTLNRNHIHKIRVCYPPLSTQRKIAAILSAYDDLIENNARRIAILERMAQLLYREWFVRFRFPGHEDVEMVDSEMGPIPAGWKVGSYTEVADVLCGGTPRTKIPEYWEGHIPFFSPRDIKSSCYVLETERSITELGLSKCSSDLYPKATVFITARGTVGKVVMPAVPMAMNQTCYALVGKNGMSQYFVFLSIRSQVEKLQQRAHGAVFDTIIMDTFHRLRFAKPPLHLADQFYEHVAPLFDLMLNLLHKNQTLRRTRDLLLPRLISGEVDVSNLDINTGDTL